MGHKVFVVTYIQMTMPLLIFFSPRNFIFTIITCLEETFSLCGLYCFYNKLFFYKSFYRRPPILFHKFQKKELVQTTKQFSGTKDIQVNRNEKYIHLQIIWCQINLASGSFKYYINLVQNIFQTILRICVQHIGGHLSHLMSSWQLCMEEKLLFLFVNHKLIMDVTFRCQL